MTSKERKVCVDETRRDGNTCLALGAGVGVLGAVSAAVAGAACPLCVFAVPGLVGLGAYKRWQAAKMNKSGREDK